MCRKPGKLPADTISETYNKEYGSDTIEIHTDAINSDDVVLIHDDVLATGGTALASKRLVSKFNPKEIYLNFLIEIDGLCQKDDFGDIDKIYCLMTL
jgi:adenine phosphoribosyltransferase